MNSLGKDVFSRDQIRLLQETFGNCQQPLEHNGPVTLSPTMPSTATQAALTLNAWRADGGLNATGIALRINGTIKYNGTTFAPLFPGAIQMFSGTAAQLAVYTSNGWNLCDGTNGTPDLRDKWIVCKGTTYTTTGGAATHDHGAATGAGGTGATGSSTTGITVNNHTGTTTSSGTGNTGKTVTGILITDHSAGVTGSGGTGATGSGNAIITSTQGAHTHTNSPSTAEVQSGTGATVITAVPDTGSATPAIASSDSGHTHTGPSHTHTTPALSHSITEPDSGLGHVHTGPAHTHDLPTLTHTVNDAGHTHTGPSHTHSITAASNIPPYYALTFIMFIGA